MTLLYFLQWAKRDRRLKIQTEEGRENNKNRR
jgi:hypothetical protein